MSLLYFIHVTFRSFICILQECWKMLAVYKRIVGILFLFFCLNIVCPSATHHSVWPTEKSPQGYISLQAHTISLLHDLNRTGNLLLRILYFSLFADIDASVSFNRRVIHINCLILYPKYPAIGNGQD